jgi:hypothetical protein
MIYAFAQGGFPEEAISDVFSSSWHSRLEGVKSRESVSYGFQL